MLEKTKIEITAFLIVIAIGIISCGQENSSISLNGTWHVEENSQLYGTQLYDAQVTQLDSTKMEITNFYKLGTDIYVSATLDEFAISIGRQNVSGYTIQGTGTVKSDFKSITFNFTASDSTVQDVVVAQFKR